jgi:hypothetical protein
MLRRFIATTLVTYATFATFITPVKAQYESMGTWRTMGKTNSGNILSLNIDAVKTFASGSLRGWKGFVYSLTDEEETRIRAGFTNYCHNGRVEVNPDAASFISTPKPGWIVPLMNEYSNKVEELVTVEADSPASKKLLSTVCAF